eukprot:2838844-Rhodomonas_salina.1
MLTSGLSVPGRAAPPAAAAAHLQVPKARALCQDLPSRAAPLRQRPGEMALHEQSRVMALRNEP